MAKTDAVTLGTSEIVWKLTDFYAAPDDKAITADVARLTARLEAFERDYKGQLGTKLGAALAEYGEMAKLMVKLQAYFDLILARDTSDTLARKEASRVQEAMAAAQSMHLTFLDLEAAKLSDAELAAQAHDPVVAHHMPLVVQWRKAGKYFLEESVERTLSRYSPFGSSEWADMMSELETGLRFELDGTTLTLPELLHVMSDDGDGEKRARALAVLNNGLQDQKHTYFAARTLNLAAGFFMTGCEERGYTQPIQSRNIGNMVDDATVNVLHEVVEDVGGRLSQRFYKLKARLLKQDTLRWSDRNAPMPFAAKVVMDWDSSCALVTKAYHEFSPTLGKLVETVLDKKNGWVDAPPSATKISGAFDYTTVTPEGVRSYMLLNHLGNGDDVMTLAHELGHAVHGMLGAEAQGPLMWHAPMVYAETASIFGEMLTFESLIKVVTDPREKLAMYMDKMMHFVNTVVRQISFSQFEQALHAKRCEGKFTSEELDTLWQEIMLRFYGEDGDVFTYADTSHLWCYVSHFYAYTPFYVYAYAFGELFTQSLMATRGTVGAAFEPKYLDLLRAGGTKDAVALMKPFGLDPNERSFWEKGIEGSMGVWLAEAEKLVEDLGY